MRDLADFMNDALAERTGALSDLSTGNVADRLRRKVRFRRARRHTLQAGGVAVILAVLGTASWFGLDGRHDEPQPAVSPTTATPTLSPTPTSEATPAQTPGPAPVAEELPGLPASMPMPAGLLAGTTPGWVLTVYRPSYLDRDSETAVAVRNTVLLVSPTAERYRVLDLPVDTEMQVVSWRAGATTALAGVGQVSSGWYAGAQHRAILDLLTGTLTVDDAGMPAGGKTYVGQTANGSEVWSVGTDGGGDVYTVDRRGVSLAAGPVETPRRNLIDPSGHQLIFEIQPSTHGDPETTFGLVDLVRGGTTELGYGVADRTCSATGWLAADQLLAFCYRSGIDDEPTDEAFYRITIDGSSTSSERLESVDGQGTRPTFFSGSSVSEGVVAFEGIPTLSPNADPCPDGAYLWEDSGVTRLREAMVRGADNIFTLRSEGAVVYVEGMPGCSGDLEPISLTAHASPDWSGAVELAPVPLATPDVPVWLEGLTSWAVGS